MSGGGRAQKRPKRFEAAVAAYMAAKRYRRPNSGPKPLAVIATELRAEGWREATPQRLVQYLQMHHPRLCANHYTPLGAKPEYADAEP